LYVGESFIRARMGTEGQQNPRNGAQSPGISPGAFAFCPHPRGAAMNGLVTLCELCEQPFLPQRRTARFCSPACRVAAFRRRASVTAAGSNKPTARALERSSGTPAKARTASRSAAVLRGLVTLSRAVGIEHDERWPDLWRVRFGDGTRSGPLNRARALEGWHALKLKKSEGQP
jgi:hypothetical protein